MQSSFFPEYDIDTLNKKQDRRTQYSWPQYGYDFDHVLKEKYTTKKNS